MVKKKDFTGRLAEPIKVGGNASPTAEAVEKFILLLEHYGIESRENGSHWCELAMSLAKDFVPGLQLEHVNQQSGRGRPGRSLAESVLLLYQLSLSLTHVGDSQTV